MTTLFVLLAVILFQLVLIVYLTDWIKELNLMLISGDAAHYVLHKLALKDKRPNKGQGAKKSAPWDIETPVL